MYEPDRWIGALDTGAFFPLFFCLFAFSCWPQRHCSPTPPLHLTRTMFQLVLFGLVAFVAYVAYKHIASQPGSVAKGTYTDKLFDKEVSGAAEPAQRNGSRSQPRRDPTPPRCCRMDRTRTRRRKKRAARAACGRAHGWRGMHANPRVRTSDRRRRSSDGDSVALPPPLSGAVRALVAPHIGPRRAAFSWRFPSRFDCAHLDCEHHLTRNCSICWLRA